MRYLNGIGFTGNGISDLYFFQVIQGIVSVGSGIARIFPVQDPGHIGGAVS